MNNPLPLSTLGKYRLIATIGRGGMAHIHLARMAGPLGFNKLFVVKVLRDDLVEGNDECVTMFLDEARLAARLSHANIVQTYDVGEVDGRYFIAMEYLEGQSLRVVERRLTAGGFPLSHQLRVLSELAKGLHHAHELKGYDGEPLNVVHRDVSPQNVFLTYDGQVKLLDFGIARADNAVHLTKPNVIKGKAEYIAPEQIRGEAVDRRADIFSLGVMLYEAVAQQRFAGKGSEITKMHDRVTGSERKLREVCPQVPERLAQVCERALSLQPEARQASALELAQELDAYLAEAGLHPTPETLSELIAPAFREEREQLNKLVEAQMKLKPEPVLVSTASDRPSPSAPAIAVDAGERTLRWLWLASFVVVSVLLATYLAVRPAVRGAQASDAGAVNQPAAPRVLGAAPATPSQALAPAVRADHEAPPRDRAVDVRPTPEVTDRKRPHGRSKARVATAPTAPTVAPTVAPVVAPKKRPEEVEPGADIEDMAPARSAKPREIELEEDPYK